VERQRRRNVPGEGLCDLQFRPGILFVLPFEFLVMLRRENSSKWNSFRQIHYSRVCKLMRSVCFSDSKTRNQKSVQRSHCTYLLIMQVRCNENAPGKGVGVRTHRKFDPPLVRGRCSCSSVSKHLVLLFPRILSRSCYLLTSDVDCHGLLQCESNPPPLKFFCHFFQTVGNFQSKFYTPIIRSYLRWTTNFYSIICNFDEVTP